MVGNRGTDGDGEFAVPVRGEPSDGGTVPPAREGFVLFDQGKSNAARGAAQRGGGVQSLNHREDAVAVCQCAVDGGQQVLDVVQQAEFRDGRDFEAGGEGGEVFSQGLHDKFVFLAIFGAVEEFLPEGLVFLPGLAAGGGTGEGDGVEFAGTDLCEKFGGGPEEGVAGGGFKEEAVAIGVAGGEAGVQNGEGEGGGEFRVGSASEDDFFQFALADAAGGGSDHAYPIRVGGGGGDGDGVIFEVFGDEGGGVFAGQPLPDQVLCSFGELDGDCRVVFVRGEAVVESEPGCAIYASELEAGEDELGIGEGCPARVVGITARAEGKTADEDGGYAGGWPYLLEVRE